MAGEGSALGVAVGRRSGRRTALRTARRCPFANDQDAVGELHCAHLVGDSSDRQGCRRGHGSLPMIELGVRTARSPPGPCPRPHHPSACRRSSAPTHRDFADPLAFTRPGGRRIDLTSHNQRDARDSATGSPPSLPLVTAPSVRGRRRRFSSGCGAAAWPRPHSSQRSESSPVRAGPSRCPRAGGLVVGVALMATGAALGTIAGSTSSHDARRARELAGGRLLRTGTENVPRQPDRRPYWSPLFPWIGATGPGSMVSGPTASSIPTRRRSSTGT